MRKRVYGRRLSRDTNERKALFRSMATSLITYGKIDTTEAKAKAVRPWVEKLVTRSKVDSLHVRRRLLGEIPSPSIVEKLISSVGPVFASRPGGYTRIIKMGPRIGDSAPMVRLEFVEDITKVEKKVKAKTSPKAPAPKAVKKVTAKKESKKEVKASKK